MSEKKQKAKMKTDPYGVRFDKKKFDFVKGKENLETPQTVVNFLLDDYYMRNKFQDLNRTTNEIKPFEQPKANFEVNIPPKQEAPKMSTMDDYRARIEQSANPTELKKVVKEFKSDSNLADWKKATLDKLAIERSKQDDFYND